MSGSQPHLCGIKPGPLAVYNAPQHRQIVFADRIFTGKNQHRRPVRDLGTVAGGDLAELAVKNRLER